MGSGIVWERLLATYIQFSDSLFCLCLLCMSYTQHIEGIGHADKYTLLKQAWDIQLSILELRESLL